MRSVETAPEQPISRCERIGEAVLDIVRALFPTLPPSRRVGPTTATGRTVHLFPEEMRRSTRPIGITDWPQKKVGSYDDPDVRAERNLAGYNFGSLVSLEELQKELKNQPERRREL